LDTDRQQHRKHIADRILRASTAIAVAHVCFKLIGLPLVMVLGRYVDKGVLDAVYVGAFEGCIFTVFLIGEEVIGPAFLPVFMREMDTRGKDAAWTFANTVVTVQFMLLLAIVGGMVAFPELFIRLVTSWSSDADPDKFALACDSLTMMAPALLCLSLGSTTYMILNGHKRFFLAAFGDASWKIVTLLSVLVGMGFLGLNWRALVFGIVFGSFAKLGTHLLGLLRELREFRIRLSLANPAVRAMLLLMMPLIAGIIFAKVRDVFNNQYILSYVQTEGLMTANSFGRKLYTALGWLVPYTISIAMFPFFCELVDRNDRAHLGELLTHSGRMLLAVFIPFSIACLVFSRPLTSLLFEGGEFGATMTSWTSVSMACYTLVLPAYALEYLLIQAFFANRKMISVTLIGMGCSAFSVVASFVGIRLLGATDLAALMVVACGFVASRTLKTTLLVAVLKPIMPLFPTPQTLLMLAKSILVGAVAAGLCLAVDTAFLKYVSDEPSKTLTAIRLVANGAACGAGFLAGILLFRLREPWEMVQWGLRKVKGTAGV
jgi:putative peptidoglycan lipid II flippase